jgi:hypothetical protein
MAVRHRHGDLAGHVNPAPILGLITARETVAGLAADQLREQISVLWQQLSSFETELADLARPPPATPAGHHHHRAGHQPASRHRLSVPTLRPPDISASSGATTATPRAPAWTSVVCALHCAEPVAISDIIEQSR